VHTPLPCQIEQPLLTLRCDRLAVEHQPDTVQELDLGQREAHDAIVVEEHPTATALCAHPYLHLRPVTPELPVAQRRRPGSCCQ
jgi:hypothetical protein